MRKKLKRPIWLILKMEKRGLIAAFLFAALLISLSSVQAYEQNFSSTVTDFANIQFLSLRYEPYPVEPGEQFKLWIKIQNVGSKAAEDARCRIIPDNPFSIYQGQSEKAYGRLDSANVVFDFVLKVNESAVEGDNELAVECTDNPSHGWLRKKIIIKIQTRYATLNIVNVRTSPEFIEPGQNAQLLLSLENMADSSMKDIDVKLDFSSVSLAPYQEIGEKKLRRLNAGEINDLIFSIMALPDAKGGMYKVPLRITYTDELGKEYSINGTVSIEVNSKPELEAYVDSTTLTKSSKTGKIVLKIVNKGLTDIKFMSIRLLGSRDIKIILGDTAYIGNIDSDDFETADFRITAKKSKLIIPAEMDYRDINNKQHSEQVNVTFNLASPSELGTGGGSSWLFWIILPAIAIIAYVKRKWILEKARQFRRK